MDIKNCVVRRVDAKLEEEFLLFDRLPLGLTLPQYEVGETDKVSVSLQYSASEDLSQTFLNEVRTGATRYLLSELDASSWQNFKENPELPRENALVNPNLNLSSLPDWFELSDIVTSDLVEPHECFLFPEAWFYGVKPVQLGRCGMEILNPKYGVRIDLLA